MTSFLCLTQRSTSSILQSSILSVYIAFLTCSALASFPSSETETVTTRCRDFTFIQSFFNGENERLPKNVSFVKLSSEGFGSSPLVYNAVEDNPMVSLDWLLRQQFQINITFILIYLYEKNSRNQKIKTHMKLFSEPLHYFLRFYQAVTPLSEMFLGFQK